MKDHEYEYLERFTKLVQDVEDELVDPNKALFILRDEIKQIYGSDGYKLKLQEYRMKIAKDHNIRLGQWCCVGGTTITNSGNGGTDSNAYRGTYQL